MVRNTDWVENRWESDRVDDRGLWVDTQRLGEEEEHTLEWIQNQGVDRY
jgi:hypothetical protein